MNTTTNSKHISKTIFRKFSFLANEAVWQFALVTVIVVALVDGALSIGGSTIA